MQMTEGVCGELYRVDRIQLEQKLERQLEIMGVFEGVKVLILQKKNNSAVIFKVRGTRLAVGYKIASGIQVRSLSDERGH